jgi:hypothetical protein
MFDTKHAAPNAPKPNARLSALYLCEEAAENAPRRHVLHMDDGEGNFRLTSALTPFRMGSILK